MTKFKLPKKVDAAFNMINSFRHLCTGRLATDHLKCIADSLKVGGLYVLGLHLTPSTGEVEDVEAWSARRGNLCVNTRMCTIDRDPARREERLSMTMDIYTPTNHKRWEDEIVFRMYSAQQMDDLLQTVPQLEVAATYDFAYRINQPIEIDESTEDVVYILRKTRRK